MEYSIYEIETSIANYRRDDSNGYERIAVKIYMEGELQEVALPVEDWKKLIAELPEAIRILTQGEIDSEREDKTDDD